ncbi:MAG: YbaN family protein [Rhodospirillaceae bacterium]|jgi:uncharacterized protein|nr:YbaN family protein [Rhodospirillaceae bacterium]MBT4042242.1 YbaN family protein [Rhodospirillaceae bacterium]MBT4691648.1 YbaN family protein [Rhodospirillaceae bacterium]MBT5082199.1 YbaN family protein [Rhodospirillaceae bacterium]MBT5526718.1 YbaN family protein [Rhodospirillaceae bacterium]
MTLNHSANNGQSRLDAPLRTPSRALSRTPLRAPSHTGPQDISRSIRYTMLALGFVCTVLGIVGIILPVMPGTVFLLIAAWAFSRSSERLHLWLYHHPRFGRTIRDWQQYRAIPMRGKVLAITMMSASFTYVTISYSPNWLVPTLVAATLIPVAIWIATRPTRPYGAPETSPR